MALDKLAADIKLMHEKMEVAKTIAAEAAGEGEKGMMAVANVINNRSISKGKSPSEIISEKNQFYGATAKNRDELYREVKPTADKMVEMMYQKKLVDNTGGAEYFRQPTEKIRKWHGEQTVQIGNHIFHKAGGK
jgi:N-acetylmuramoyl-L-alanine amidase